MPKYTIDEFNDLLRKQEKEKREIESKARLRDFDRRCSAYTRSWRFLAFWIFALPFIGLYLYDAQLLNGWVALFVVIFIEKSLIQGLLGLRKKYFPNLKKHENLMPSGDGK